MKYIKMFIAVLVIITIVISGIAFKSFYGFQKLYQCNIVQNKCLIINPMKSFRADVNGTLFTQSVLRNATNPPTNSCDTDCPNDIKVSVES